MSATPRLEPLIIGMSLAVVVGCVQQPAKIRFIHLNHSNPALVADSEAQQRIREAGMSVAVEGERVPL